MNDKKIAIKTINICKDFAVGEIITHILFDISCEIYFGELTMLVGPSGCGKTTLISIISSILSATSGEVYLMGEALAAMTSNEKVLFRRNNIGFIFQQYNLIPTLTAAENVAIPLLANDIEYKKAITQAEETLAKIGMAAHVKKLPNQLSGGEQQRVAIARAFVHNPKIIICDEPTASLDTKTGLDVMQILAEIALDVNRAVLIVTHDARTYHMSKRIVEMSDGRIIGDYSTEEFIKLNRTI